jgi:hypothetical protein
MILMVISYFIIQLHRFKFPKCHLKLLRSRNVINVKRNNIYFIASSYVKLTGIFIFPILVTFIPQNPAHPVPNVGYDPLTMAPLSGSYVSDAFIYTDAFWCKHCSRFHYCTVIQRKANIN